MSNLSRFVDAHSDPDSGFAAALTELEAGQKRGHWIWYIFPQLAGLGASPMAVHYGVQDIGEAVAYVRDPLLRRRLMAVAAAVARPLRREPPARLEQIMGSAIDARKVVSSMTLFGEVARRLNRAEPHPDYATLTEAADTILRAAAVQGLPPCEVTLQALRQG